jgi:3D (Asp-Asp-Asp) domain-containing protein
MKANIVKILAAIVVVFCLSNGAEATTWASKHNMNARPSARATVARTYPLQTSNQKIAMHSRQSYYGHKPKEVAKSDKPKNGEKVSLAGTVLARLTVYWSNGSGTDRWSRRGQSSTGTRLKSGHCAVDPRKIPYGSRVQVFDKETKRPFDTMTAVDTGTAVKYKKASGGKCIVIDKYFPNKSDALRYDRAMPDYVLVKVIRS